MCRNVITVQAGDHGERVDTSSRRRHRRAATGGVAGEGGLAQPAEVSEASVTPSWLAQVGAGSWPMMPSSRRRDAPLGAPAAGRVGRILTNANSAATKNAFARTITAARSRAAPGAGLGDQLNLPHRPRLHASGGAGSTRGVSRPGLNLRGQLREHRRLPRLWLWPGRGLRRASRRAGGGSAPPVRDDKPARGRKPPGHGRMRTATSAC